MKNSTRWASRTGRDCLTSAFLACNRWRLLEGQILHFNWANSFPDWARPSLRFDTAVKVATALSIIAKGDSGGR